MLSFVHIGAIILAMLASFTIYFIGDKHRYLRFFPIFFTLVQIAQLVGLYLSSQVKSNVVLYNVVMVLEFCFYFHTLYLIVRSKLVKRIIAGSIIVFAVLAILNMCFLQTIGVWNSVTYALGALLIVAICIYYFFELFQLSHPVNVARQPAFWICVGLIFYYACTFPLFGLVNFIKSAPPVILVNLETLILLLNIFLYSSFTIAFLCRIRARNSMS